MQPIQAFLTLLLIGVAIYAYSQRRESLIASALVSLVTVLGLVLVWRPDAANVVANEIGVGRGADLLLYCFSVLAFGIGFNVHLRLKLQHREITELSRRVAIETAWHAGSRPEARP